AFHCEVYFINKVEQMAIPWGTDSKVQYMEPTYGFPISIGAGGEMSLRVEDSQKLLIKLVGTESFLSREKLILYFRAFLMSRVKTYIAQIFKISNINIFEVDEHLNEFSDALKEKLIPDFSEYGIALERFFVTRIVKPDGDIQYEKFKDLHFRQYADIREAKIRQQVGVIDQQTEAQKMVIESQGIAQKRQIEGYTYQQERGFDVMEHLAQNEGAGNFSSAGIGLGMMAGVGGVVGSTVEDVFNGAFSGMQTPTTPQTTNIDQFCEECGANLIHGMAFCDKCGHPVSKSNSCSKCGYVFERQGKFCPKCGTKREG
ncbi:MAG: SPFH domain-containing protein, partial [Lachnospiraceae bacterium]|nr:SPFH domain-containing protein [Lachnospiraceae bacterium]